MAFYFDRFMHDLSIEKNGYLTSVRKRWLSDIENL